MNSSLTLLIAQAAESASFWGQLFEGMDSGKRFALIIVGLLATVGSLIAIVSIVAGTISSMQRRNIEAKLKEDMLDRGMSAEEVAQIIEATPPKDWLERWATK